MKKAIILLISLLLLLSLCACAKSNPPYTVEKDWKTYTIDPVAKTIADDYGVYHYTFSGNTEEYQFSVTYPDGSLWSWTQKGGMGSGGGSKDHGGNRYAKGHILRDVILEEEASSTSLGEAWPAILLIALGAAGVCWPKAFWLLSIGWQMKDAEPTKAALVVRQSIGGILMIIGIILFFPLLFG